MPGNLICIRALRTWSLRARLLATQVALLALVCAAIGVGTKLALQRFLMNQLDYQLVEAGRRSMAFHDFGPPSLSSPGLAPSTGYPRPVVLRDDLGPGPAFLNAPGQSTRTVGAVISHGTPVDAGVITADGARAEISTAAAEQLARIPNRQPVTINLDGLGRYRVTALGRQSSRDCPRRPSTTRYCGCW